MTVLLATALSLALSAHAGEEAMVVESDSDPAERAWSSSASVTLCYPSTLACQ